MVEYYIFWLKNTLEIDKKTPPTFFTYFNYQHLKSAKKVEGVFFAIIILLF